MFVKRRRRAPLNLPLTAMIDIFSLIVIFLIKGTVFGVADVSTANVKLPISVSKETVESAPQVLIAQDKVRVSALQKDYPLSLFKPENAGSAEAASLKKELADYIAKITPEAKSSGVLLNVVADRSESYEHVFDAIRLFRESGFQTLLFIATGANVPGGGQ